MAKPSSVKCVHPVGFEPTPPKRLGLKSNALDQLGHGYERAAWNSSDDGGVRTHARRLVPKTSASGRSRELRPLGHIINVRDSDRVRTRIDLGQRIDPATLAGVDFKSTALTTRPHYLALSPSTAVDRPGSRTRSLQISSPSRLCVVWCVAAAALRRRPDAPWWRVAATAARRRASANNSDGTRTRNPQIRSLIRCPLRHGVVFVCVEEQGFEPWAFRMQSGRSATELHPL